MPGSDLTNMLYGGGPVSSSDLPTPMNVVDMLYGAQRPPPMVASTLNPQPDDIRRLFFNHIIQRAPPNPIPAGPDVADAIRRSLFTAGDEI